ncbi:MAG: hypothetical protein BroJett040_11450 [Oligoflexia bacterium]|nr:MAG: hypothetical protein BroJett040_11450 [Oligoflexia bacterium]
MKSHFLIFGLLVLIQFVTQISFARMAGGYGDQYPLGPNPQTTPGVLCNRPDGFRYAEKIKYCNRNVDPELKREIIVTYDRQFGFTIERMDRRKFKIDHFIPLCVGGGNDRENLWPQHESIYKVTDPLEALICEKMAQGRLRQEIAVQMIRAAKSDLKLVPEVTRRVRAL